MDTKVRANFLTIAAGLVIAVLGAAYGGSSGPIVWLGLAVAAFGFIAWQVNARRRPGGGVRR